MTNIDEAAAMSGSAGPAGGSEEALPVLPDAGFVFDRPRAALVVIDPQNDFLSPDGAGWPVFGQSASPHKIWGPQSNDLALQLRKRDVSQVVLAGMAANLCVESHLRHLLEEGFEVAVVRDATAGPRLAAGDGYLAALTNYSFLAHAVWLTEEAVSHIR